MQLSDIRCLGDWTSASMTRKQGIVNFASLVLHDYYYHLLKYLIVIVFMQWRHFAAIKSWDSAVGKCSILSKLVWGHLMLEVRSQAEHAVNIIGLLIIPAFGHPRLSRASGLNCRRGAALNDSSSFLCALCTASLFWWCVACWRFAGLPRTSALSPVINVCVWWRC